MPGDFFFDQELKIIFNSRQPENSYDVGKSYVSINIQDDLSNGAFSFIFKNDEYNIQYVKRFMAKAFNEDFIKKDFTLTIPDLEENTNQNFVADIQQTQATDETEESKDNHHNSNPSKGNSEIFEND